MDDQLTTALLDDKQGIHEVPLPQLSEATCSDQTERNTGLVKQFIHIVYQELFQPKNQHMINNALIIPVLQIVVQHVRPFVLVLSSLFFLILIMTTVILVFLILRQ